MSITQISGSLKVVDRAQFTFHEWNMDGMRLVRYNLCSMADSGSDRVVGDKTEIVLSEIAEDGKEMTSDLLG